MNVPDKYVVRSGERNYVVLTSWSEDAQTREFMTQTDVGISTKLPQSQEERASVALAEPQTEMGPITMRSLVESEFRESFVEIRDTSEHRKLITTIEILSPSNKRRNSQGWRQYLRKRQAHLEGSANLVEIDLLRGGSRMPMEDEWPESPYYLLVSRRNAAPECQVGPALFLLPLPQLPIPLAGSDPDVPLELQPLVESIFEQSRYDLDIDYTLP